MRQFQQVPLPDKMSDLPRDERGYPVPYVVFKDNSGKYHFKINDSRKQFICSTEKVCSICGQPLNEDLWLVGGQESAFNPRGAYGDSGIHYECGVYALQVCPYLAMTRYTAKTDIQKLTEQVDGEVVLWNPTQSDERLPFFVFIKVSDYDFNILTYNIKPVCPYLEIEFWADGQRVSEEDIKDFLLYNPKDYV